MSEFEIVTILKVLEKNLKCSHCSPRELVEANHRDEDGKELIDHCLMHFVRETVSAFCEFEEHILHATNS